MMPYWAVSRARALVNPITAALVAPYAVWPPTGAPTMGPVTLLMLTILPYLRSIMPGSTALAHLNMPNKFISNILWRNSSSISTSFLRG